MTTRTLRQTAAAALLSTLLATPSMSQPKDEIAWSVTPYLWAVDTSLELTALEAEIAENIDIPFDALVDILDAAFQIHVEGGRGNWSSFVDFTYLKTSDTVGQGLVTVQSEQEQLFVDGAVAYWPNGVGTALSLYGGVRYTSFDNRYNLVFRRGRQFLRRTSNDYPDALFGVRYRFDLSERWSLLTRGDVNFGDSEGTWLAEGLLAYTVGKRRQNRIVLGYRHKEAEYIDPVFRSEFDYGGVIAGFNFRF